MEFIKWQSVPLGPINNKLLEALAALGELAMKCGLPCIVCTASLMLLGSRFIKG